MPIQYGESDIKTLDNIIAAFSSARKLMVENKKATRKQQKQLLDAISTGASEGAAMLDSLLAAYLGV
jgi:hypothetical protein